MGKDPRWDMISLGCLLGTHVEASAVRCTGLEVERSGLETQSAYGYSQVLRRGDSKGSVEDTEKRGLKTESQVTEDVQTRDRNLTGYYNSQQGRALPSSQYPWLRISSYSKYPVKIMCIAQCN